MPEISTTNANTTTVSLQCCIDSCLQCYRTCLSMATNMCLAEGGRHAGSAHISLMLGCAEICRTAAHFMIMESRLHQKICAVCADVCEACAVSCQQIGDMGECVEICRHCADNCRRMALGIAVEL